MASVGASTVTEAEPVAVVATVSLTEKLCEPGVTSVAEKAPVPLVSVALAGRTTPLAVSVLEK